MNGYICFHKGKQYEIYAETTAKAQEECAKKHRIKQKWDISVMLAEKDGEQVTHTPDF